MDWISELFANTSKATIIILVFAVWFVYVLINKIEIIITNQKRITDILIDLKNESPKNIKLIELIGDVVYNTDQLLKHFEPQRKSRNDITNDELRMDYSWTAREDKE